MPNPAVSNCLKTGCQLEIGGLHYWGDLHQFGPAILIFNAVIGSTGQALVQQQRDLRWPTVHAKNGGWERRGVFVLALDECDFNSTLAEHLARWYPSYVR